MRHPFVLPSQLVVGLDTDFFITFEMSANATPFLLTPFGN